jgi:hypothetical protein
MHGKGVFTHAGGSRYEGGFMKGTRHGKGVLTFADGTMHEEGFVNGEPHGQGVYRYRLHSQPTRGGVRQAASRTA